MTIWPFKSRPARCEATTFGNYIVTTPRGVRLPQGEVMLRCSLRGPHDRHYGKHDGTGATWVDGQ